MFGIARPSKLIHNWRLFASLWAISVLCSLLWPVRGNVSWFTSSETALSLRCIAKSTTLRQGFEPRTCRLQPETGNLKYCEARKAKQNWWTSRVKFGLDPPEGPPTPPTPTHYPHPDKKGTDLLFYQIGIHLHTHQDLQLKCCRVMGQNLRYGHPCTRDLPGTHNWLAQSHIASISSEFHWLPHAGTIP